MQYSPKLKNAMKEIKEILVRYDVAGSILLHTPPEHSEYLNHITTSYSCLQIDEKTGKMRFRSRLIEDHNGDLARKHEVESATVNMIVHFAKASAQMYLQYDGLLNHLKESGLDITEDDDFLHSSGTDQSN